MTNEKAVSRKLLAVLGATLLLGAFMAQRSLLGSDAPADVGFDGSSPLARIDDTTVDEPATWETPANPRNPFLPFQTGSRIEDPERPSEPPDVGDLDDGTASADGP